MLTVQDIIMKKRENEELSTEEINFFITSVVQGNALDCQIGAWLMAVFFNGMSDRETVDLTKAMVDTGDSLKWSSWRGLVADKHSTGGVGDKISLVLAPALAACKLKVPMLSGRGLTFTGGTLDKLESIRGFRVLLTPEEMEICMREVGCFIAGVTTSIAPADRILYRVRDLTGTVECLPLIVSSIISKKVAEGVESLVVDVKVGNGAFLKSQKAATELAKKIIKVSKLLNIKASAILSDMNIPIGRCVGNALEVKESVECLRNEGSKDVIDIVKKLGGLLLRAKGIVESVEEGEYKVEQSINNFEALYKFRDMIIHQGVSEIDANELCNGNFSAVLPKSKFKTRLKARKSGFILSIKAIDVAKACWYLGAGRSNSSQSIDYAVGVKLLKSVGEEIKQGEDWIEIHYSDMKIRKKILDILDNSLIIEPTLPKESKFSRIISVLQDENIQTMEL